MMAGPGGAAAGVPVAGARAREEDLVISDAVICDGTGRPAQRGHVVVRGSTICAILGEEAPLPPARVQVRADGRILAPGFIDVHAHSDYAVLSAPESASKLAQGVTTEIVGNCGFSAFPLGGALRDDELAMHGHRGLGLEWTSAADYFERVRETRPAVNVASFVGHRNVRAAVMGFEDRRPTHAELRAMAEQVEAALDAGALGLSTGLIYVPGLFADTEELIALVRLVARRGGLYASHVRGEGDRLLSAAQEFFEIVDATGVQAQFSHLKASGRRNWGKVEPIIAEIDRRVAAGQALAFDRYPYVASSTELASLLPRWVVDGGREAALRRLGDAHERQQIARELADDFGDEPPWADVLVAEQRSDEFGRYVGWRLADIAADLGADPMEVFFELLRANALEVWICHFTMSERDMERVLTHPLCMVCTDAESRPLVGGGGAGAPHPRGFGAFARFVEHFVRRRRLLSLEEAVHKMTGLPAATFGLSDRGRIAVGAAADLVLFDAETIADRANFGQPPQPPVGIELVVVNGAIAFRQGRASGERRGQVLLREKR